MHGKLWAGQTDPPWALGEGRAGDNGQCGRETVNFVYVTSVCLNVNVFVYDIKSWSARVIRNAFKNNPYWL